MSFKEKIDKVLKHSTLVSNINQIEKRIGVSTGTIQKAYNEGRAPGLGKIKKIIDSLGINQTWWDTGKGEMFIKSSTDTRFQLMAEHNDEAHPPTLLQILLESVRGVNKLVDANNGLVDKLDKDKNWALAELEKLHAKFGIPKESEKHLTL